MYDPQMPMNEPTHQQDIGAPVRLHGAALTLDATPPEATTAPVEVETEVEPEDDQRPKAGDGRFGSGQDAHEASALGVAARQRDARTPRQVLLDVLREQVKIAEGRAKGTTPATRTAAAKVVGELQERLHRMPEGEERIDWARLGEVRRSVMRRLVSEGEGYAMACLALDVAPDDEGSPEGQEEDRA